MASFLSPRHLLLFGRSWQLYAERASADSATTCSLFVLQILYFIFYRCRLFLLQRFRRRSFQASRTSRSVSKWGTHARTYARANTRVHAFLQMHTRKYNTHLRTHTHTHTHTHMFTCTHKSVQKTCKNIHKHSQRHMHARKSTIISSPLKLLTLCGLKSAILFRFCFLFPLFSSARRAQRLAGCGDRNLSRSQTTR